MPWDPGLSPWDVTFPVPKCSHAQAGRKSTCLWKKKIPEMSFSLNSLACKLWDVPSCASDRLARDSSAPPGGRLGKWTNGFVGRCNASISRAFTGSAGSQKCPPWPGCSSMMPVLLADMARSGMGSILAVRRAKPVWVKLAPWRGPCSSSVGNGDALGFACSP